MKSKLFLLCGLLFYSYGVSANNDTKGIECNVSEVKSCWPTYECFDGAGGPEIKHYTLNLNLIYPPNPNLIYNYEASLKLGDVHAYTAITNVYECGIPRSEEDKSGICIFLSFDADEKGGTETKVLISSSRETAQLKYRTPEMEYEMRCKLLR